MLHLKTPALGGSVQNSQSPNDAEDGAVIVVIWILGPHQNRSREPLNLDHSRELTDALGTQVHNPTGVTLRT